MTDEIKKAIYYFDGYGSPHDELVIKALENYEQTEDLAVAYNNAIKEISLLKNMLKEEGYKLRTPQYNKHGIRVMT